MFPVCSYGFHSIVADNLVGVRCNANRWTENNNNNNNNNSYILYKVTSILQLISMYIYTIYMFYTFVIFICILIIYTADRRFIPAVSLCSADRFLLSG